MSLKKSILRVFSANFLNVISGILIGFIVPAVLSVEGYSYVKTYTFYISYIGFLHFGFVDGMYIKYGGKEIKDIDIPQYKSEHNAFILMQSIITIIFVVIGVVERNMIIFLMGISILPINTLSFHKLFYQATGQFKEYSKVSYIYTLIYFVLNILLAIIFRSKNYVYYCLTNLIANGVVYITLEYKFYKNTKSIKVRYTYEIWGNIKIGFFVLIGNLSVMLFYAMDRWFIKFFLEVNDFAYYSFAVSMLNIINLLVGAIAITFYNYIAKGENEEKIKKFKNYLLLMGSVASFGYFVLAIIVNMFLHKYIPALNVISISFASYPYMMVINALYVNLYKIRKNEKKYMVVVIGMVFVSVIYNMIAILLFRTIESIAFATTLSFITWYVYSVKDFNYLKPNINEIVYLTIITVSFLICSNYLNEFIGAVIYMISMIIIMFCCYKDVVVEVVRKYIRF